MASKPIDPQLLAWFKGFVNRNGWLKMGQSFGFYPGVLTAVINDGKASAGTIKRIEALKQDQTGERSRVARQNAARIIESASYFLPDRQQAILDALGPDVLDDIAVNGGVLPPLPRKNPRATKA